MSKEWADSHWRLQPGISMFAISKCWQVWRVTVSVHNTAVHTWDGKRPPNLPLYPTNYDSMECWETLSGQDINNTKLLLLLLTDDTLRYCLAWIQQKMLVDDRFQSSIEAAQEEHWLPMQVLATVAMAPTLPEDIQVEVMKVCLTVAGCLSFAICCINRLCWLSLRSCLTAWQVVSHML